MKKITLLFIMTAVLGTMGCSKKDEDTGDDPPVNNPPTNTPKTAVPDEIVGAWEYGYVDFEFWENYTQGYWAGRNAGPMREAMIFTKTGEAKYYRYEFAFGLYEELVDCEGTVAFGGDGTFTFYPVKGRKRFYDTRNPVNTKDRALTSAELTDPKWAGKRGYVYDGSSDPPALRITVPSSAPYNWYKKY